MRIFTSFRLCLFHIDGLPQRHLITLILILYVVCVCLVCTKVGHRVCSALHLVQAWAKVPRTCSSLLLVPAQARRLDVCCVTTLTNHSPIVGYFLFYLVKVGVNSDDFLCRSWFVFPFQNSFLTGPLFTSILEQCVHFSRKRWSLTLSFCGLMFWNWTQ